MKKLIFLFFLFGTLAFIFKSDPLYKDPLFKKLAIHNKSNETIYLYIAFENVDSLPIIGNLTELDFIYADSTLSVTIRTYKNEAFPNKEKGMTLFFITKETLLNHDLKEIYQGQLYVKRILLTKKELENKNSEYIYTP